MYPQSFKIRDLFSFLRTPKVKYDKNCLKCNEPISKSDVFCTHCGTKILKVNDKQAMPKRDQNTLSGSTSPKSPELTYFLCLLLGGLGAHRFYLGKKGTGLLMLLTAGGLGLWVLVDLILITTNKFEDKQGKMLTLTHAPSSLKKGILIVSSVIGWLIVFVTSFVLLVYYITSSLVSVVDGQLTAFAKGNYQKAYEYTSKIFKEYTPYNKFEKFVNAYPVLKNNQGHSFTNQKIENNIGLLQGTLTAKDGTVTPIKYTFVKEDGAWKITSIILLPPSKTVNNPKTVPINQ